MVSSLYCLYCNCKDFYIYKILAREGRKMVFIDVLKVMKDLIAMFETFHIYCASCVGHAVLKRKNYSKVLLKDAKKYVETISVD